MAYNLACWCIQMAYTQHSWMLMDIVVGLSVRPSVRLFVYSIFRWLCICWQITWNKWHKIWHDVVIIGRWLLPSLVDTGDICCHYWQLILVFNRACQLCKHCWVMAARMPLNHCPVDSFIWIFNFVVTNTSQLFGMCKIFLWSVSWSPIMWSSLCNSFEDRAPMGARSSNESQWIDLKIGHQDNSPSNVHQTGPPYLFINYFSPISRWYVKVTCPCTTSVCCAEAPRTSGLFCLRKISAGSRTRM